jgi:hypothetical protein
MRPEPRIEGRIRVAALLVLAGMAIEAVTLNVLHPLSFVVFAAFGVLAIGAGIVVFLLAVLQAGGPEDLGSAARSGTEGSST